MGPCLSYGEKNKCNWDPLKNIIMRFLSLLLIAFMVSTGVANAQTQEEMDASLERVKKLEKLTKKAPKPAEVAEVAEFVSAVYDASKATIGISNKIHEYNAKINDPATTLADYEGILKDLVELKTDIENQANTIKEFPNKLTSMSEIVKGADPKAALTCAKPMKFAAQATPVVGAESAFQAKVVVELITFVTEKVQK